MDSKKTLVIGASEKEDRYSNMAIKKLRANNHSVVSIGNKEGKVLDVDIIKGRPAFEGIDTVTLYINPKIQQEYYDYILGLHPKRIIFNPGTENIEFETMAEEKGIKTIEACTLVMLSIKNY
jgi:hypothetical protein